MLLTFGALQPPSTTQFILTELNLCNSIFYVAPGHNRSHLRLFFPVVHGYTVFIYKTNYLFTQGYVISVCNADVNLSKLLSNY